MEKLIKLFNYLIIKMFSLMPINQHCIVLNSIPDYSDNAWAFYRFLLDIGYNKENKIVWLVKDPDKYKKKENVEFVSNKPRVFWIKRDYYLATSKYVVFTHTAPIRIWRKKQVFVCTTHSASQLKATSGAGVTNPRLVIPDYYLRCGEVGLERMMNGRGVPREKFVILGMPRLDILFSHKECISILFPEIKPEKTIIALETFKQAKQWKDSSSGHSYGLNIIKNKEQLLKLDELLYQKNLLLVIKPHPLQDLSYISINQLRNIRFITDEGLAEKGIQLYELVENCDCLLTDYSSIYYDYLLLNRPIGFMVGDMDEYKRGFIIDDPLKEMPGAIIHENSELLSFIEDLLNNDDQYEAQRLELKNKVFAFPDNQNSKRLFSFLKSK